MSTKKIKKEKPVGACPICWQYHEDLPSDVRLNNRRTQGCESPGSQAAESPNIIFVTDYPLDFTSRADRLLVSIADKFKASPVWISAKQCSLRGNITLEELKRVRELVLAPLLERHLSLPVVVFGEHAAKLVAGGNPSETSMVNKALEYYGHICAFTYTVAFYLDPEKGNRDNRILANIEATIKASLIKPEVPAKVMSKMPFGKSLEQIIIDVETTGHEYPFTGKSELICIGVLPVGKPPYIIRASELTDGIRREFARNTKLVVGHNIMFDLVHLAYVGVHFPKARVHDTMIYYKNLYPNELYYGLKPLAKKYHSFGHWDSWFASKHRNREKIFDYEYGKLCDYNAVDLYATEALFLSQRREYLPFKLEMDYLRYVLQMTLNGFCVDTIRLNRQIDEFSAQISKHDADFRESFALGKDFNLNSPAQVLSYLRRTIPNLSDTNAGTLEKYKDKNPFIEQLLDLRGLVKLKGTSLEGLKEYIDGNSLVHSSYSVHGAETGRSSSSSPNLQNTDPRVRSLFISRHKEGKLIHTDLSGIEYRLIGHLSKDRNLLSIFNTGKDIHDEMYLALFKEPPPNKERRKKAKTANFCVTPDTPILTSDLTWAEAGTLKVGDQLIAFDENQGVGYGRKSSRRWRNSQVLDTHQEIQPCFEILLSNGDKISATAEHQLIVKYHGAHGKSVWVQVKDLKIGNILVKYVPVWKSFNTYNHGWLSGFYDGEGHLTSSKDYFSVSVGQKPGELLDLAKTTLKTLGYPYQEQSGGNSSAKVLALRGKLSDKLRFLGEVKPKRLLSNMRTKFNGDKSPIFGGYEWPCIVSITPIGNKPVVVMKTSTQTFIGNGYGNHNCGVYGGGYKKFILSAELPDCKESQELYHIASNRYPGVAEWKEGIIRELYRSKIVRNLFGRIRRFDYINMDIEREAINWIVQSSGHDILKIYSMEMCDLLRNNGLLGTLLVSEVHDSNTFDSPPWEIDKATEIISNLGKNLKPLIEEVFGVKMRCPIFADVEVMDRWS